MGALVAGQQGKPARNKVRSAKVRAMTIIAMNSNSEPASPAIAQPETLVTPRLTPRYKVLIHNDDVTPMDYVVYVLMNVFKKSVQDAAEIMIEAHNTGVALVEVLPLEEAELRIEQAHSLARTQKFPLTFTCEPE
jgi:ATP-dependent Clp protease adaptor protein ClpS